jgi:hypothetical protein
VRRPHRGVAKGPGRYPSVTRPRGAAVVNLSNYLKLLERAKGFEPSTPTLARLCSTPELHPHPRRVTVTA